MTHIVNQDRDLILPYDPNGLIYTSPVLHDGNCYGYNLMYSGKRLGTFDSEERAVREYERILKSTKQVHLVAGYSNGGFGEW